MRPATISGPTGDYDEAMCMVSRSCHVSTTRTGSSTSLRARVGHASALGSTWTMHQTVRKMYVIDNRPGQAAPAAHLANAHTAVLGVPCRAPTRSRASLTNRRAELWVHNGLNVGVWEATPGSFPASRDGYDEVFVCLSGERR